MKCNRSACSNENAICRHSQTAQFYCPSCARKINEFNPGLVVFPQDNTMLRKLAVQLSMISAPIDEEVIEVNGRITADAYREWAKWPEKQPITIFPFKDAPESLQRVAGEGIWIIMSPEVDRVQQMVQKMDHVDEWDMGKVRVCRWNNLDQFLYVIRHY